MTHDRTTSPKENGPSGSTPPPNEPRQEPQDSSPSGTRGVEFVRGQDLDEWEDMLVKAAREVNAELRAKGLLPEQQEPKSKDE